MSTQASNAERSAKQDPTDLLHEALQGFEAPFAELRYHAKKTRSLSVEKGRVNDARIAEKTGVGVRVLEQGTWGFASTAKLERNALRAALEQARQAARASAAQRKHRIDSLPSVELCKGRFEVPGSAELAERPIEERLDWILALENQTRSNASSISTASCSYSEIFEEKGIVTSDGAKAWTLLTRPEFRLMAVAAADGEMQRGAQSVGGTGGWSCLFSGQSAEEMSERVSKQAVDLLSAKHPEGGRKRVLLSPSLVGLLTHEAIGHTVEADFVQAGSCAAGRLGDRVASELVTLCDSGVSEYSDGAGGTLSVDDEGVRAGRTVVIENGLLKSYLHDRESAANMGVAPTGNARAWEYDNAPLIRMRNTYIQPGDSSLEELIANIDDGYLMDGPRNGQADANGEFMFGTGECWRIQNGKKTELLRGANITGIAFDVLASVDGVGKEFEWDLGAGHCGKGQPAKVDAGGPWVSCEVLVGGRQ